MEGEGDALGLRALKIAMISYFLNRKQERQDSKYAPALLFDLVLELTASERTRTRMENTVCVNTSGKPGDSKHRDMVNEHIVRETKSAIKGMHSNLKESINIYIFKVVQMYESCLKQTFNLKETSIFAIFLFYLRKTSNKKANYLLLFVCNLYCFRIICSET